jgi:hypothetical protein
VLFQSNIEKPLFGKCFNQCSFTDSCGADDHDNFTHF